MGSNGVPGGFCSREERLAQVLTVDDPVLASSSHTRSSASSAIPGATAGLESGPQTTDGRGCHAHDIRNGSWAISSLQSPDCSLPVTGAQSWHASTVQMVDFRQWTETGFCSLCELSTVNEKKSGLAAFVWAARAKNSLHLQHAAGSALWALHT